MDVSRINKRGVSFVVISVVLAAAIMLFLSPKTTSAASGVCQEVQQEPVPASPEPAEEGTATAPNCRYGVSASSKSASLIESMKIGWHVSFSASEPTWLPPNTVNTPMIRFKPKLAEDGTRLQAYTASPPLTENGLGRLVRANPGAVWVIGNEVDRVFWQDDLTPDVYAIAYHDAYHFIKQYDPTAQIATSALVLVSPGRLQYLDIVLDTYKEMYGSPMPVDVWTFHAYLFPELQEAYNGEPEKPIYANVALGTDRSIAVKAPHPARPVAEQIELCKSEDYACIHEHDSMAMLTKQVVDMRTWMKERGYQNRPLMLTEWSLLHPYEEFDGNCSTKDEFGNCFTPARVTAFMEASVPYLEAAIDPNLGYPLDNYRMVQQWSWFAMDDLNAGAYTSVTPGLLVKDGQLTPMGSKYGELIQKTTTEPNLVIDSVFGDIVDNSADAANIKVSIRNNGNTPTTVPFDVKFYSDANRTQEIGRATVPAGLAGCAVIPTMATIEWQNLDKGVHRFWVTVDGDNVVGPGEPESKNGSSFVLVEPVKNFLPSIAR